MVSLRVSMMSFLIVGVFVGALMMPARASATHPCFIPGGCLCQTADALLETTSVDGGLVRVDVVHGTSTLSVGDEVEIPGLQYDPGIEVLVYENDGMLFNPLLITADGTVSCGVDDALDVATAVDAALSTDCYAALEAAGLPGECDDSHASESGGSDEDGDGCGCHTTPSDPPWTLSVLLAGLAAIRRRRTRLRRLG